MKKQFPTQECNYCGKKYEPKRTFQKYCSRACGSRHNVMFPKQERDEHSTVYEAIKARKVQWPIHMDLRPDEPI